VRYLVTLVAVFALACSSVASAASPAQAPVWVGQSADMSVPVGGQAQASAIFWNGQKVTTTTVSLVVGEQGFYELTIYPTDESGRVILTKDPAKVYIYAGRSR